MCSPAFVRIARPWCHDHDVDDPIYARRFADPNQVCKILRPAVGHVYRTIQPMCLGQKPILLAKLVAGYWFVLAVRNPPAIPSRLHLDVPL